MRTFRSYAKMSVKPTFWELARQALSNTSRGYDLLAPKFEATSYATPVELVELSLERVESHFPVPTGLEAQGADLACGTGRAARALCCYCSGVDGFDFSRGMLDQAEAMSSGLPCSWHLQDLGKLSLSVGKYHRVVTFGAWGHVLPLFRNRVLRQTLEALAPGGVFLTLTADEPNWRERRFWFNLAFDTGMRVRNRLWPGEFHMYYGLNNTASLVKHLREVASEDFLVIIDKHPLLPSALSLLMVRRRPND